MTDCAAREILPSGYSHIADVPASIVRRILSAHCSVKCDTLMNEFEARDLYQFVTKCLVILV